jgi:hypothetical protein
MEPGQGPGGQWPWTKPHCHSHHTALPVFCCSCVHHGGPVHFSAVLSSEDSPAQHSPQPDSGHWLCTSFSGVMAFLTAQILAALTHNATILPCNGDTGPAPHRLCGQLEPICFLPPLTARVVNKYVEGVLLEKIPKSPKPFATNCYEI